LFISILSKCFRCSNESNQKAIRDRRSKAEICNTFGSCEEVFAELQYHPALYLEASISWSESNSLFELVPAMSVCIKVHWKLGQAIVQEIAPEDSQRIF
jgi:hypothetical protein